ncbi:MAG: prepilin-type N-terminal cleavage/methylation domain-containing protein [Candidatus Omnitrophica bacterium]|nr:prepilin-type N-terminal cleavage/methylation domain-containing protein [Candidatus Omnitrophota bacterium]
MIGKQRALTLIELLIASSIFVLVMTTVYSAFHAGLFGFKDIDENLDIHQTARIVLERLNLEMRNMFVYSDDETRFKGDKTSISFLTLNPGYTFVSYSQKDDKIMRLAQSGKEALKEQTEIEPEELAASIKALSFTYGSIKEGTKELEWVDSWEDRKDLPAAVKVNITIASQEFERTIYLR